MAWRESRRGNLGRINYLIRVIMIVELPIVVPTTLYAITTRASSFEALLLPALFFWSIAFSVVCVRSAGLIAAEKARQTLDVLVVTPLPLSVLVGEKWRGLWRVMAVVSVPILIYARHRRLFANGLRRSSLRVLRAAGIRHRKSAPVLARGGGQSRDSAVAGRAAGVSVRPRDGTQVRATVGVLGLLFIWCMLPLVIRVFTGPAPWILYFSPFAGVAVNQVPELGLPGNGPWQRNAESGGGAFYLLVHCAIYATIVVLLAWLNYRVAGRVLVRPWGRSEGRRVRGGGVQKTAVNVCR